MKDGIHKPFGKAVVYSYYIQVVGGDGYMELIACFRIKNEMTTEHFEEWFHDSLIPNAPPKSLIVIDIAPYHSE